MSDPIKALLKDASGNLINPETDATQVKTAYGSTVEA